MSTELLSSFFLTKESFNYLKPEAHILILDYSTSRIGTPTIEPWVRKSGVVTSHFVDAESPLPEDLLKKGFTHIIHSGSELSIMEESSFTGPAMDLIREAATLGIAQMGICYGSQLICKALVGGEAVRASPQGFEAGWEEVSFNAQAQSLMGVNSIEQVWQHHFDEVSLIPDGASILATNKHTRIQAWIEPSKRLLGTQFHPEVVRRMGNKIFRKDRQLLEEHGYDLDKIVLQGPSPNIGKVIFDYFIESV